MTASEQAPDRAATRPDTASKARGRTWERSRVRKTLRRGAYATQEGAKEVARFAGVAALCTVAAAAFGALVYLDYTNGEDQSAVPAND